MYTAIVLCGFVKTRTWNNIEKDSLIRTNAYKFGRQTYSTTNSKLETLPQSTNTYSSCLRLIITSSGFLTVSNQASNSKLVQIAATPGVVPSSSHCTYCDVWHTLPYLLSKVSREGVLRTCWKDCANQDDIPFYSFCWQDVCIVKETYSEGGEFQKFSMETALASSTVTSLAILIVVPRKRYREREWSLGESWEASGPAWWWTGALGKSGTISSPLYWNTHGQRVCLFFVAATCSWLYSILQYVLFSHWPDTIVSLLGKYSVFWISNVQYYKAANQTTWFSCSLKMFWSLTRRRTPKDRWSCFARCF